MTFEDLPCRDFVELATDYLEGAGLNTDERIMTELHLLTCAPCMDYLDQMRGTMKLTADLRDDDVPDSVMDPLVEAFRRLSEPS